MLESTNKTNILIFIFPGGSILSIFLLFLWATYSPIAQMAIKADISSDNLVLHTICYNILFASKGFKTNNKNKLQRKKNI